MQNSQYNLSTIYSFWADLSDAERQKVTDAVFTETYQKGMLLHRVQDNCKGMLSVLSGSIRVYILSDEGREVTLFRVPEGEVCVLSASCLMESIDFDVVLEAAEDTEVLVLPILTLNEIIKENTQVELFMLKVATEKFSDVMWTMQQILFKKIDQRIAEYLWDEYIRSDNLTLKLTHDEIARNIGSAREVVSKVLKYMAEQGIVSLGRGSIEILDKDKLSEAFS